MGHRGKVHHFLYAAAGKYGCPGLAAGIDVGMVSEDGKGMAGNRPGSYMEYAWQQFARYFIEVRHHEEEALGGGKCSGERAGNERAVYGARCPGFGLHFRYFDNLPENIFPPFRCPFIGIFRHGG